MPIRRLTPTQQHKHSSRGAHEVYQRPPAAANRRYVQLTRHNILRFRIWTVRDMLLHRRCFCMQRVANKNNNNKKCRGLSADVAAESRKNRTSIPIRRRTKAEYLSVTRHPPPQPFQNHPPLTAQQTTSTAAAAGAATAGAPGTTTKTYTPAHSIDQSAPATPGIVKTVDIHINIRRFGRNFERIVYAKFSITPLAYREAFATFFVCVCVLSAPARLTLRRVRMYSRWLSWMRGYTKTPYRTDELRHAAHHTASRKHASLNHMRYVCVCEYVQMCV